MTSATCPHLCIAFVFIGVVVRARNNGAHVLVSTRRRAFVMVHVIFSGVVQDPANSMSAKELKNGLNRLLVFA